MLFEEPLISAGSEVVLYYRDGVSNGQFKPVLTWELQQLTDAFRKVGTARGQEIDKAEISMPP